MQITLTSLSAQNEHLLLEYPEEFDGARLLEDRRSEITIPAGKLRLRECWFEGACLICSEFKLTEPSVMHLQCDNFCWLMIFLLEGELKIDSATDKTSPTLRAGGLHTSYCSSLNTDIILKQSSRLLTICLTQRFINKLLERSALPSNRSEPFTLLTTDAHLTGRVGSLINDILNAEQSAYIKRIFLEAKILELLSLQLEQLENRQTAPENFNREDKARLLEAKNLVENNIKKPCSLIELSRKTGLNDFKLKKGFKALFGHTVFGYLGELRMNMAHKLLQEGQSVSIVAETVGYKNAHHFTAAFKKRFSMLPSQINRLLEIILWITPAIVFDCL